MTVNRGGGIIDTPSNHSVDETVERLKGIRGGDRRSACTSGLWLAGSRLGASVVFPWNP